jgi:hypothetical protein
LNEYYEGDGVTIYEHACRFGCEGIVSKRLGIALAALKTGLRLRIQRRQPLKVSRRKIGETDGGRAADEGTPPIREAAAECSIGRRIDGSSFSGLLTRVEIGHVRIGAAGNGRITSLGSASSPSQRAYLIAAVSYKIHTVLTDNGIQFTNPAEELASVRDIAGVAACADVLDLVDCFLKSFSKSISTGRH